MKLQTINNGKPLEFNEDIEINKLDIYHNEYFLDLLEMVDKLRIALDNTIDVAMSSEEYPDSDVPKYKELEKEATELLIKICE